MLDSVGSSGSGDLIRDIRDHEAKIAKLRRFFSDSWKAFDDWRDDAVESYQFVGNQQWRGADLRLYEKQKRPALVINEILKTVLYLCGLQRQQRQEIKVYPFEGGDVRPAELMNGLVKHVDIRSRGDQVDSWVFQDKVITGMGYWKMTVDYSEDPLGELKWIRRNPLTIFPDPNFLECGWNDAKFVMEAYFADMTALIDEYPDKAEAIRQKQQDWLGPAGGGTSGRLWARGDSDQMGDAFGDKRNFWDAETQRARVLECWYADYLTVHLAIDQNTGAVSEMEGEEAKQAESEMKQAATPNAMSIPVKKRMVRCAKLLDNVLLYDGPSPFGSPKFPIVPAIGHYHWGVPYGNVQYQKDPNRFSNKAYSSIIEMIAKMPHSGYQIDDKTGPRPKEIVDYMNGNGVVITHRGTPATAIAPPQLDQAVVYLQRIMADNASKVVNVNTEQLGSSTQRTTSGRAIEARQRGGMVVHEPLLDTFEGELRDKTLFTIEVIPKFISVPKALRILGTIAVRVPDNPAAAIMQQQQQEPGGMMELEKLLSGAYATEFDTVVKTIPYEPSLQAQRWEILLDLFRSSPPGTIPIPLMARAASDAGLLSKADAEEIIQFQEQQKMAMQAAGQDTTQPTPRPQGLFQGQPGPSGPMQLN